MQKQGTERKLIGGRRIWLLLIIVVLSFSAVSISGTRRNGKIAFISDRDGNSEIYVMNPDGTDQVRITNNSLDDGYPSWSPNGRMIAFISQRVSGEYALFKMNADGTGRTEITSVNYPPPIDYYGNGWMPGWSPDGGRLVFRDSDGIYIVDVDGNNRRFLTGGRSPAWSPDGSKILFIRGPFSGSQLHTIRPDGTDLQTLPPLPNSYNSYYDATWSPTGSKIAVTAYDGANEVIFTANADGTNPQEFIFQCATSVVLGCSRLAMPNWSPDGRTIAFFFLPGGFEIHVKDLAGGESRRLTDTIGRNSHPSWQSLPRANFDFDGDGRSDISVFRPSDRVWYLNQSTATQFGLTTDKITPADYDGDGRTDIAVFRDGTWWRINSSDSTVVALQFGIADDIPVPVDFTGDGRDELAVYRGGAWWMQDLSNGQTSVVSFGLPTDKPVPADYDSDGRVDQAVYRGSGEWHLNRSTQGYAVIQFGLADDRPVPADYDGDGKTDLAVYRDGVWYILQSSQGFAAFQWGISTDIPAPADYDGDGRADAAIFRDGAWWLRQSTNGVLVQNFGLVNDVPVPAAYLR